MRILTPVLLKAGKRANFLRDWRLPQLNVTYLVKPTSFKCILHVLEHFSCKEENKLQIPLALCIRLEYII